MLVKRRETRDRMREPVSPLVLLSNLLTRISSYFLISRLASRRLEANLIVFALFFTGLAAWRDQICFAVFLKDGDANTKHRGRLTG
jgi:hypothetical protein